MDQVNHRIGTKVKVPIKRVVAETPDAHSIYFDLGGEADAFAYQPGQHIIVYVEIDGKPFSRSYSLFTAPHEKEFAITVKRVKGGRVSNYINDHFQTGDEIWISFPRGNFSAHIQPHLAKMYYFFGGGSGITPLLSNIKTILAKEPLSQVFFLYGNRNSTSIIHHEGLNALERQHPDRLVVQHELVSEGSIWGKGLLSNLFQAKTGWIDRRCILFFLRKYPASLPAEYFICGPSGMMDNVENVLMDLNIPSKQIHLERFVSTSNSDRGITDEDVVMGKCELTYSIHGIKKVLEIKGNTTLFQALTDAGEEIPHSCLAGSCASCACFIKKGKVKMLQCHALNERQLNDNFILACQAVPQTPKIEVDFDTI